MSACVYAGGTPYMMPLTVSLGAARYAKISYLLPRSAIVLTLSYRLALFWLGVLMTMIF